MRIYIKNSICLYAAVVIWAIVGIATPCKAAKLTKETLRLKQYLLTSPKRGVMFGHHDDPMYGLGWKWKENRSDVKSVCGDYPAVMSFDMSGIELGHTCNLDSVPFERIRKESVKQYLRGGIVSLSWHLNNPSTGKSAWDVSDSLVVSKILTGGNLHKEFLRRLDCVAAFLGSIKTNKRVKVPIIFRPWHENNGTWFWWGIKCCTAQQYKALWKMTIERFATDKVDNVLYAYSPGADPKAFADTYPGDNLIDIVGFDQYQDYVSHDVYVKSMRDMLQYLTSFSKEHHKIMAVTETGYVTLPDSLWWTHTLLPIIKDYPIAWVLVWRNAHLKHFYAPYPGQKSAADFINFYKDKRTLFCKDINIR